MPTISEHGVRMVTGAFVSVMVLGLCVSMVFATRTAAGFYLDDSMLQRPTPTPTPLPGPVMIAELPCTQGTANSVAWNMVSGAVGYQVQCARDPNFLYIHETSSWITGLSYGFTSLSDGLLYFYRVRGRTATQAGDWSLMEYSMQDAETPDSQVMPLPMVCPPVFPVTVASWDSACGVAFYKVYYRRDSSPWLQYNGTFLDPSFIFDSSSTGGDGFYEFYSVAEDEAGNIEAAPVFPDAYTLVSSVPTATPTRTPTITPTATPSSTPTPAPTGPTGTPSPDPSSTPFPSGDTCEEPAVLTMNGGTVTGDTCPYMDDYDPQACLVPSEAPDMVFEMVLDECYSEVTVCLTADFDAIMYLRVECPGDPAQDLLCSDEILASCEIADPGCGYPYGEEMELTELGPGTYYIFVDGYQTQCGAFCLAATGSLGCEAPDSCPGLMVTVPSGPLYGNTCPEQNLYNGSCNSGTTSPDGVYGFTLDRCYENVSLCLGASFPAVLYLRADDCEAGIELGCSNTPGACDGECPAKLFTRRLDLPLLLPGTYYAFVDGAGNDLYCGGYCLEIDGTAMPPIAGDACAAPISIAVNESVSSHDTICALDDLEIQGCGVSGGGNDMVFQVDLSCSYDLDIRVIPDGWDAALAVRLDECLSPAAEIACAHNNGAGGMELLALDDMSGTLYVIVDGVAADQAGTFTIEVDGVMSNHCADPVQVACGDTLYDQQLDEQCNVFGYYDCDPSNYYATGEKVYWLRTAPPPKYSVQATIYNEASDYLAVFILDTCDPLTCLDGGGPLASAVTNESVYIVVDGIAGTAPLDYSLEIRCLSPTPTPTNTPTATRTPTATLTPTITITPTPAPIPVLSHGGWLSLLLIGMTALLALRGRPRADSRLAR